MLGGRTSCISPFKFLTSCLSSKSKECEVVVKLTDTVVEEKIAIMECGEQSKQENATPELSGEDGVDAPDSLASESLSSFMTTIDQL